MESRSALSQPASLGVQVTLTVNGSNLTTWLKTGMRAGDASSQSPPGHRGAGGYGWRH